MLTSSTRRNQNCPSLRAIIGITLLALSSSIGKPEPTVTVEAAPTAYIRCNQAGYLPGAPKIAVLFSHAGNWEGRPWEVVSSHGSVVLRGTVGDADAPGSPYRTGRARDWGAYGSFEHHYRLNLSALRAPGTYSLRLDGFPNVAADPLIVRADLRDIADSCDLFYRVQRCGNTYPLYHSACHTDDAAPADGHTPRPDLSGGWHDAGDYLKFFGPAAYAALMMSWSALETGQSSKSLLAQEARVGCDWLMKMNPDPDTLYFQVGDEADHDRADVLPGEDTLARKAYSGAAANLCGRGAAALALASILNADDPDYSKRCLAYALRLYDLGDRNRRAQGGNQADFYPESSWQDDMELAAACIARALPSDDPRRALFLARAENFAEDLLPRPYPSGLRLFNSANMEALAHYEVWRLAGREALKESIASWLRREANVVVARHDANPFGLAPDYGWGTASDALDSAFVCYLAAAVHPSRPSESYRQTAAAQLDFVLGTNSWGESFLTGAGSRFPRFQHYRLLNLVRGKGIIPNDLLLGALAGGPGARSIYQDLVTKKEMDAAAPDPALDPFDSADAVYHDSPADYVSNEPSISDNAIAWTVLTVLPHWLDVPATPHKPAHAHS